MSGEFGYGLAFVTGVAGALHCLGMCGGFAGSCALAHGRRRPIFSLLQYHGTRILLYTLFGMAGALAGRVLVQSGLPGKIQGVLMMGAGLLVVAMGARLLFGHDKAFPLSRPPLPLLGGVLNGLVPCSLVFSVAVPAAATADPLRAGLLMLSFGLGTLPTMVAVSLTGGSIGSLLRDRWAQLAGIGVIGLGLWTAWEGWVFFDIMRGLANW